MKVAKNFSIQEFVPKNIYDRFGDRSTLYINPLLPEIAQLLRDRYNKSITINNWLWGGDFNNSGFRSPICNDGAPLSRHKLGLCIDVKVNGLLAKEVQEDVIKNYDFIFKEAGITAIEADTPTWTHLSVEWTNLDNLVIIPKF